MAKKKDDQRIKSFEALGATFGIEPIPIPETVGFLGREEELQMIQNFLKSDKRILEISGVPMIGKSMLVREYCQKNTITNQFVYFEESISTSKKDLEKQLFVGKAFNDFSGIARGTVLIIENFERALEWLPNKDNLHKIKDYKIHEFFNEVIKNELKIIILSRFKTSFHEMHRRFVQKITLKGIETQFFWELYQQKNFDKTTFDALCKRFDSHTGLLALAYDNAEELYENELLRAIHNPTSTSKALWEVVMHITKKLKDEEQYVLAALTLWQQPRTKTDLENALQHLEITKLESILLSLREKLLVQEIYTTSALIYTLNPYLAEVYYAFMERDKGLSYNFMQVKKLPAFQKIALPAYDEIAKAHKQSDFRLFYELIDKKRKAKQFDSLLESLQKVYFEDYYPEAILNEIGITYREAGKLLEAKRTFEQALKLDSKNVKVLNELAITHREEGNLPKAKQILEEAINLGNLYSYTELAIIHKEEGNLPEAKRILKEAITLEHTPAMNELAKIYFKEKNYEQALQIANEGLIIEPNSSYLESTKKAILEAQKKVTLPEPSTKEIIQQNIIHETVKIQFIAAQPHDTPRLKSEYDNIVLKAGKSIDNKELVFLNPTWEIDYEKLLSYLKDRKPHVLHYAGHGTEQGLNFINNQDRTTLRITDKELTDIFAGSSSYLKLVFLNSCFSYIQAKTISKQGIYALGIKDQEIANESALQFAECFYVGLTSQELPISIEKAIYRGCNNFVKNFPPKASSFSLYKDGEEIDYKALLQS